MPLSLPPPGRAALLLDLDGTLLDLAPTPESVVVPPGLVSTLNALRDRLDGALAIVTGRPIAQIDALLPHVPTAVAGEHGGAIRHQPEAAVIRADLPEVPDHWRVQARTVAAHHPGARLEEKQRGLVFHYRANPAIGPALHAAALALITPEAARFQVMEASMAWEIRPRGADKGVAVHRLMQEAPFRGRLPIFIGDDVTDEDGIRAARQLGGAGLRVDAWFTGPDGVRAWLQRCVTEPEWLLP